MPLCYLFVICIVPSVVLTLTHSREGQELLAGSNLNLTADITVDSNIDTPHIVSAVWHRNGNSLSSDERIDVLDAFSVPGINQYRSQVVFSSLSSTVDSGTYTCTVVVDSELAYPYITSASATSSTPIDVNGEYIVFLTHFLIQYL